MAVVLGAVLVLVGALVLWTAWSGSQRPPRPGASPSDPTQPGSTRAGEAASGLGVAGGVLCLGGLAVAILGLDNPFGVVALVAAGAIAVVALVVAAVSAARGARST